MPLKLVLANKAYSSWSLRPWILLAHFKIPFEEVVIAMDQPDTRAQMLEYAPTGKCPSLHDGAIAVWESLRTAMPIITQQDGKLRACMPDISGNSSLASQSSLAPYQYGMRGACRLAVFLIPPSAPSFR